MVEDSIPKKKPKIKTTKELSEKLKSLGDAQLLLENRLIC
jgi:hypothetical protein